MKLFFVFTITLFLSHPVYSQQEKPLNKDLIIDGNRFLQIIDKPIKNAEVKRFLNDTTLHFIMLGEPFHNNSKGKSEHGASYGLTMVNYASKDKSIELIISDDILSNITLNGDKYKGKLPYNLNWNMTRKEIEKIIGAPDNLSYASETDYSRLGYMKKHLLIRYDTMGTENSKMITLSIITLGK